MYFEIYVNIYSILGLGNISGQEGALHLLCFGKVHVSILVCEVQPNMVK